MNITEKHISFKLKEQAKERDKEIFNWILSIYRIAGKFPTLQEMAQTFGFSKERARQRMERLVKDGYIFKNRKQGWRTTYLILLPKTSDFSRGDTAG
ncbi:MAG: hypothetical protein WC288_01970 [Candidatus Paceibacterota bacterium]|jgi:DNA-binding GntR family transcriptional regulator